MTAADPYWDPAGYVLNGSYTQLSTDCLVGGTCTGSGTVNVNLNSGTSSASTSTQLTVF